MNTSLHRPTVASVKELDNSSVITLTITDDKGNDSYIFFNDYNTFLNFSKVISRGGTYGIDYDLKTGEKITK